MAFYEDVAFGEFKGKLARPESVATTPRPGVLVMPDAWGIAEFSIDQAGKLADLGYVALAGDPYGGGFLAKDAAECAERAHRVNADPAVLRANVRANMDALVGAGGVDPSHSGAIGYCLGGTMVLELARSGYACCGVVSFHGSLQTTLPAAPDAISASILVCTGAEDPYAPIDHVTAFQDEMTAAHADCQVVIYTGAQHSFTNPDSPRDWPGIAYHPRSAARAWETMERFLDERTALA